MKKILTGIALLLLSTTSLITANEFNYKQFGSLPVLYNGRVQPLDTLARQSLLYMKEKQSIKRDGEKVSASQWLLDVFSHNSISYDDEIFKIDFIDIIHEFKLDDKQKYYSFNELKAHILDIEQKGRSISQVDSESRSAYQENVFQLYQKISLYLALQNAFLPYHDISLKTYINRYQTSVKQGLEAFTAYNNAQKLSSNQELYLIEFNQNFKLHKQLADTSVLYLFPNTKAIEDSDSWKNTGASLLQLLDPNESINQLLALYAELFEAYNNNDSETFNQTTSKMHELIKADKSLSKRLHLERQFHHLNPFYKAIVLYCICFIIMLFYYLSNSTWLYRISGLLCVSAFALHSYGLIARMLIQNRPPVTNLYSSAVFIGWFAILLSFVQEKYFKNKLGYALSSVIGFITLIIAHHLSLQGDTLEMMQAVLNSNFWLSTHVITITLGYSGTFVAGMLATAYLVAAFIKPFNKKQTTELTKMIVGIVAFSLLFSFVGTVLGGIWADQSWGRFWGWDPKENGALLIVIWNAMILHARLAKLISMRGLVIMSLFGNMVTAFSWFGVNMLGIGLHSYGFMDKAFFWLVLYCLSQLLLMLLAYFKLQKAE